MHGAGHDAVELSRSEIDATCRKAARGAGHSWGLAEEAGRAVARLSATGTDGAAALLRVLRALDARTGDDDPARHAPRPDGDTWRAAGGSETWLCPIATGVALSDRAHRFAPGDVVTLDGVLEAVLIRPILDRAREALGCGVELVDAGADRPADASVGRIVRVRFAAGGPVSTVGGAPTDGRCRTTRATLRALEAFAHRTYVPASEGSRAGAGGAADDG